MANTIEFLIKADAQLAGLQQTVKSLDQVREKAASAGLSTTGGVQPGGKSGRGARSTAKRAVGMPRRRHRCFVNTLSKAMRLAAGPQPV